MTTRQLPRFDVDILREHAGEKVFARGEAYHRDGQVELLAVEPGRVLAQVAGTEDYRVKLTGHGKNFDGECTCPAFGDWGFCKHLVATALTVNALRADAVDGVGALARIRDHLKQKSIDTLVEMIVDLAERDPGLFRKLDTAAAVAHTDDKTLRTRLRKEIDRATRTGGFVDYHEAAAWAADVDSVLDTIADFAPGARAGLARELAERALDRIEQAIENIDDSDGHCGGLLDHARDIHRAAILKVKPEPVELARDLFAREMKDYFGTFEGVVALYADALGETGLCEYRRLATDAWEKIPSYSGKRVQQEEFAVDHDRLMRILDFFAERAGEVELRIALRAKHLSSQWDYLQLAEFCLLHGRAEEALRRAEEGLWLFEDGHPDERLAIFVAGLLSKAARKGDAEACLQRAFEKAPSFELYNGLRKLGGEAARERVVKLLESGQVRGERMRWHNSSDLVIRIWMQDKIFDAAWAVVRKHGASMALKEELARASEATQPKEALEVYAQRVDQLASLGGDSAYAEATKLVGRMAKLRSSGEHAAYVLALKERYGRKRNFMKLLA
jgi:uncharacterized Zn finger protein